MVTPIGLYDRLETQPLAQLVIPVDLIQVFVIIHRNRVLVLSKNTESATKVNKTATAKFSH